MDVARGSSASPPRNPYTFTREDYEEFTRSLPHAQFNEQSEYEEKVLVEGCTLFDIYRQPRAPVVDPKVARTIPVDTLRSDLKCPVCLGIIQKATVVMECLHRFCGECIQKCIGSARKECPSCRQHIPSKRSLRKDENFDRLIQKIIPNVEEFERREAQLIEELNRAHHLNNALTESTRRGLQNQATIRRHVRVNNKRRVSTTPTSRSTPRSNGAAATADDAQTTGGDSSSGSSEEASKDQSSSSSSSNGTKRARVEGTKEEKPADRVNLRMALHHEEQPTAHKLARSRFSTSYKLKIRSLKNHLCEALKVTNVANMCIVLSAKNYEISGLRAAVAASAASSSAPIAPRRDLQFDQELEDYVSLYDIYQQYGTGTDWELELLYHFSDTIVNGVAQFISSGV